MGHEEELTASELEAFKTVEEEPESSNPYIDGEVVQENFEDVLVGDGDKTEEIS